MIAAEREKVQSKLDLASAISHMSQGAYDKAATFFLKIGSIKSLGDWIGNVRSCPLSTNFPVFLLMPSLAGLTWWRC